MTPQPPGDFENVLKRLEFLESQNRRLSSILTVAAVIGVVLAGILFTMTLALHEPAMNVGNLRAMLDHLHIDNVVASTVQAEKVVLVDAKGHTRGGLGFMGNGDPALYLCDENGTERTRLFSSGFAIRDSRGQPRAVLVMMDNDQEVRLVLYDPSSGGPSVDLGVVKGTANVRLNDSNGKVRAALGFTREIGPGLVFYDQTGTPVRTYSP
jgi:hypothetical protein